MKDALYAQSIPSSNAMVDVRTHAATSPPPPPPYSIVSVESQTLQKPNTLARVLFLWGFVCPPFWFIGVSLFFLPLRPTWEWEQGKTPEEKDTLLRLHRQTELQWAWRCLYASLFLVIAIVVVVCSVTLTIHS